MIEIFEDVRTSLDNGDVGSQPFEKVCHFEGDGAPTEDDDGKGQAIAIENIVACEVTGFLGARDIGMMDDGTGCDECGFALYEDGFGGLVDRGDLDEMGIEKFCRASQEVEGAVDELFSAVVGELGDESAFATADFLWVDLQVFGAESEFLGAAEGEISVGTFNECFAGHATAKDTEAAKSFRAVDDDCFQIEFGGGSCGGVPGASAADDGEIVGGWRR